MTRRNTSDSPAAKFRDAVRAAISSFKFQGRPLVAAVSGGADSTALLRVLHQLTADLNFKLAAAHANHALRGAESDADEAFVRRLCEQLGVPLICRRLPLSVTGADRSEGIEAAARSLRQELFAEAAAEFHADVVATAHTADDQAETVLHRIVRGTGLAGLAGIPASRELVAGIHLVRPLLELRRADVLDYLGVLGQDFREDRSNRDLAFTRNRIRHELLPYLATHFNPQVADSFVRLGRLAGAAQVVIDAVVDRLARRAVAKRTASRIELRIAALRRQPRFLIGELLRQIWTELAWPQQEMGHAEFDRIASLIDAAPSAAFDLPASVRASRTRQRLVLEARH